MTEPAPVPILVLIRDLLLASRVTTAARSLDLAIKLLREPSMLADETGNKLIVDLNQPDAMEASIKWKNNSPQDRVVLAFGSHVDAETLRAARDAGLDHVLPRSALLEKLPRLLAERG